MKNGPEKRARSKGEKHKKCEKPRVGELTSFRKEPKGATASPNKEHAKEQHLLTTHRLG
jgi:hypothetical protein